MRLSRLPIRVLREVYGLGFLVASGFEGKKDGCLGDLGLIWLCGLGLHVPCRANLALRFRASCAMGVQHLLF